mmetsp:Transcript_27285/g.40550  ORF Transcript_27285/g.40550 Transcript_27285/m.40550 type:complete len:102 (+) Transcript_27285:87-392(+)
MFFLTMILFFGTCVCVFKIESPYFYGLKNNPVYSLSVCLAYFINHWSIYSASFFFFPHPHSYKPQLKAINSIHTPLFFHHHYLILNLTPKKSRTTTITYTH